MEPQCGAAEDIAACIEEKTYNQSAIIKDIILGFSAQTSMTNQELWSQDFTHTFYGMGHTLDMETKLNPDDETTQLFIIFQDFSNYMVIFYKQDAFLSDPGPIIVYPSQLLTH